MDASRCPAGHGLFVPPRPRCPACARAVEAASAPDEGVVLTWTEWGGRRAAVVAFGEAVAPAFLAAPVEAGTRVRARRDAEGFLTCDPA